MSFERRRSLLKNTYDNLLKNQKQGFVNSTTGAVEIHADYPYSFYFDDVLLAAGNTYILSLKFHAAPSDTNDGTARIRVYQADGSYLGNITDFTGTAQYGLRVTADNRYFSEEFTIVPNADRLVKIMCISAKDPPNGYDFKLRKVT